MRAACGVDAACLLALLLQSNLLRDVALYRSPAGPLVERALTGPHPPTHPPPPPPPHTNAHTHPATPSPANTFTPPCSPSAQVDLSRYTLPTYMRIVTYKTAFYTFYLPVACGMRLAGVT